ncbi:MAG: hypothetical protein R3Y04_07120 [Rikenellaceae bacterium]
MRNSRKTFIAILLSCTFGFANAQEAIDIFNISQTSRSFSTARSAAMGGAFTALGADGASAAINPAGIGMYKANDFSVTGSLLFSKVNSTTSGSLGQYYTYDKSTTTPLNNMSLVINLGNSNSGILRSANIGIVYNRTNDLSSQEYVSGHYEQNTILNMFGRQLYGISPSDITSSDNNLYTPYSNQSSSLWGGMLAYNSGLLYSSYSSPTQYTPSVNNAGTLFEGDEIYPEMTRKTMGYTGDYGFTAGFNILDKVYVGTTLSAMKYQYSLVNRYSEYSNLNVNVGDLDVFDYIQTLNVTGSGFSFKVGAIAEVIDGLKIGIAAHAPTIYNIKEEYYADMYSYYMTDPTYLYAGTPYLLGEYRMVTAPKLLLGASYTYANTFIFSFDWERTYYNKMRVTDGFSYDDKMYINDQITSTYKASNSIRAGIEARLTSNFYARGGYAHYSNPYCDGYSDEDAWRNISGGIGYKAGSLYLDLTFVNMKNVASSKYFYSDTFSDGTTIQSDQTYVNTYIYNSLMTTIGFRF